jgi:hypothetical protein
VSGVPLLFVCGILPLLLLCKILKFGIPLQPTQLAAFF